MTDKGHIRSMCLCLLLGPHTGRAATIFGDFLLPAPSSLWKVASPIAHRPATNATRLDGCDSVVRMALGSVSAL
jgi:hypothetical protein